MNYMERKALEISKEHIESVQAFVCPYCGKLYPIAMDAKRCRDNDALMFLVQKARHPFRPLNFTDKEVEHLGKRKFVKLSDPHTKWSAHAYNCEDEVLDLIPDDKELDMESVSGIQLLLEWSYEDGNIIGVLRNG